MRKQTSAALLKNLSETLTGHRERIVSDPQSNPVKLLAYDISKDVEERRMAFKDIEEIVKSLSDNGAIARAERLGHRAGVKALRKLEADIADLAAQKAKAGWPVFKKWAEATGQGIVLTAHPTFSLSRDIRECLGDVAISRGERKAKAVEHLKTLPYLPKRAPTLKEEHADTQAAITRIQQAVESVRRQVLEVAAQSFPEKWTQLVPGLVSVYSWVGYDIDGRTDITWGDALRLRLEEKLTQLGRYLKAAQNIEKKSGSAAAKKLAHKISEAELSAQRDLNLFNEDLSVPENLVAAANNLTRSSDRRFLNMSPAIKLITKLLKEIDDTDVAVDAALLRADMKAYGLGTSRIHFRLNTRHVTSGLKSIFGIREGATDTRTLLDRASKLTRDVKQEPVNFASLALEKSTAHQQMILIGQIHKYIDDETPIRLLIAECEDSVTAMGMLYLARRYGIDKHIDISPLFETASALNNGGRIIDKLLGNPVYRAYVEERGCFAIQTGFSDAGRFMGQIPATLAIERLQSHFAQAMAKHKVKNVTAIVFNTHGEGNGRGGHPGNIKDRVDYVMSPWAVHQFEKRGIPLCHETSFQGGDGFMWFQNEKLAKATVTNLVTTRAQDTSDAEDDIFYQENDFSWDVYRTLSTQQDSLYHDPDYVTILGGFGQNLLIPTGSRAAKRAKAGGDMFDPRQLRAIPHNAILQQMGAPANIFYGVGAAAAVDPEKFDTWLQTSARAGSLFSLVTESMNRADLSVLTAYGRLFDPGFWVSRAMSGNEPVLERRSLEVAETLGTNPWRSQIMDLVDRLRMDAYDSVRILRNCGENCALPGAADDTRDALHILHALRLAVIMKMMIIAAELPANGEAGVSRLNVLQKLQTFQVSSILEDLETRYPSKIDAPEWTSQLAEKSSGARSKSGGFQHISESIIKPLARAADLSRQITIAITHHFDAFG